ncbi:MAG: DNA-binding protein [Campylobacterales bacterium]
MKKLTIAEASAEIGISKEAIHNRIRRGSLECIIENGVKFVLLDENTKPIKKTNIRTKTTQNDDKYHKLLEEQNKKLQEKIEKLELETRELRDQKEQMLIAEKLKIEDIYIQKDEQLKSILTAITTNTMLNPPQKGVEDIEIVEIEEQNKDIKPISLNKYLKQQNISKKRRLKIKAKFKKIAKKDDRINIIDGKYFIQPSIYKYNDLIKL